MSKAPEKGEMRVSMAIDIWKREEVGKFVAEKVQSPTEAALSVKTWADCNSESYYEDNKNHYQRLNDMVLKQVWRNSQEAGQQYPKLVRYQGRIGKLSVDVATKLVGQKTKCASKKVAIAMSINEGKKLGINVAAEFADNTLKDLVGLGQDPALAGKLAVESVKVAKQTSLINDMDKTELLQGISDEILGVLNNNKQITAKDEEMAEITNGKDSLSKQNPNVNKNE